MQGNVKQRGVTLIELLVTIVVLGILLTLALPSFEGTFRSNRLATATNELTASIALARSEAIRSTRRSEICASEDGLSCSSDWNQGWIVRSDRNGNGTIGADEVVRYTQGKPKMLVTGPAAAVAFDAQGRTAAAVNLTLQPESCGGQALKRSITISATGQTHKVEALGDCS